MVAQSADPLMTEPHICGFLQLTGRLEHTFQDILRVFKNRNDVQDGCNFYALQSDPITVCQV